MFLGAVICGGSEKCPQYVPGSAYDHGMGSPVRVPTGQVFRVERARGLVWYAKYRLPDGRQVQRKVGPAWSERGRPPAGYFTTRLAEAWLRDVLDKARRGTLAGSVRSGATFADAAAEWLRYIEHDRGRKPSTVEGYRSIVRSELLPAFGPMALEAVTPGAIESWQASMTQAASTRTKALVGAAGSELGGALFLVAASTGLRMGELLALRWRDVDFAGSAVRVRASYYAGHHAEVGQGPGCAPGAGCRGSAGSAGRPRALDRRRRPRVRGRGRRPP